MKSRQVTRTADRVPSLAMNPTSPTSPTTPLAPFPVQYKSRAPEFYGFVAWSSTSFLFVVYVLWTLLPDEWIVWLGVEWYPNREWSILFPAWSIVVVLLTYFVYFALTLYGTPAFNQPRAIADSRAHFPKISSNEDQNAAILQAYAPFAKPEAIPALYDIPIGMVNRVLYGKEHDSGTQLKSEEQGRGRSDNSGNDEKTK